jgi:hypothetical protein
MKFEGYLQRVLASTPGQTSGMQSLTCVDQFGFNGRRGFLTASPKKQHGKFFMACTPKAGARESSSAIKTS